MNIDNILHELGISSFTSYHEVFGGQDSAVWRIDTKKGPEYALRVLPRCNHEQFLKEQEIMKLAKNHNLLVPTVYSVQLYKDYSVMLMEWASGRTVFQELQENPDNASLLGYEFGRCQASVHAATFWHHSPEFRKDSDWLTPKTDDEAEIIRRIQNEGLVTKSSLLHLDYHPLNVLTDGKKITAVIDWANATIGDYRFDFARTFSLLRLEGRRPGTYFEKNPEILERFEKGWIDGYTHSAAMNHSVSLFYAWAGIRMARDLHGRLPEEGLKKVRDWVEYWIAEDES